MKKAILFLILLNIFTRAFSQEITLARPQNLKAEVVKSGNGYEVQLSWDESLPGDTLTESYYIFNNFPPSDKLYLNGQINRLNETSYTYSIKRPYAARYSFAVRADAMFPYKFKSELSDTVSVVVPSVRLPLVQITEQTIANGMLTVKWKYDDILDVKEFRLLVNKEPIIISGDKREHTVDVSSSEKKNFILEMTAVSESGVESDVRKVFVSTEN